MDSEHLAHMEYGICIAFLYIGIYNLYTMSSPSKKILFSLPEELLKEIDSLAAAEHRSRSELIREATREYVAGRARKRPIDDPKVREAIRFMDKMAAEWTEPFDSTELIRQMRGPLGEPENKS